LSEAGSHELSASFIKNMVEIDNVTLNYKKSILKDVSIKAYEGECIGLLGLNGSGKSTLLSAIAGIKKPHAGNIMIDGKVGFVTQENALIEELSGIDNLMMWSPLGRKDILAALTDSEASVLKTKDFIDLKVRRMSGGMKKRLAITSVILDKPDVLLLDEPLAALDIPAKKDIISFIDTFKSGGGTVFVASHSEDVFAHCDRIYYLHDGKCEELPKGQTVTGALNV